MDFLGLKLEELDVEEELRRRMASEEMEGSWVGIEDQEEMEGVDLEWLEGLTFDEVDNKHMKKMLKGIKYYLMLDVYRKDGLLKRTDWRDWRKEVGKTLTSEEELVFRRLLDETKYSSGEITFALGFAESFLRIKGDQHAEKLDEIARIRDEISESTQVTLEKMNELCLCLASVLKLVTRG